jgi:hypothetical protein
MIRRAFIMHVFGSVNSPMETFDNCPPAQSEERRTGTFLSRRTKQRARLAELALAAHLDLE